MSDPITQEIILQSDGNFYKRTVVTSLLKSQGDAIQRIKAKPSFEVIDIPVAPNTRIASFAGSDDDRHYVFREASFFPFRGAILEPNDYGSYRMSITGTPFGRQSENQIQTRTFNDGNGLRWEPFKAGGFKLYYMHTYRYYKGYVQKHGQPYVFLYHPDLKHSYIPNLPNVYDAGRICTGDDYTDEETTLHKLLQTNEAELNNSYCNNDLRMTTDAEAKFIMYNELGITLPITDECMPKDGRGNYFFMPSNKEPILEFTSWLNNTKH